jgi:predicted peptidase
MDQKLINDNTGKRVALYPSVEDQLDMIWHMIDQEVIPGKDSSVWYSTIKEIKESLPKPTTDSLNNT